MRIGIFLGRMEPSGGTRAALDLAKGLVCHASDLKIYVVAPGKMYKDWYDADALQIEKINWTENVKGLDVAIATSFVTWDYVSRIKAGKKFGYAQGAETRFYDGVEEMTSYIKGCFSKSRGISPVSVSRNITRWLAHDFGYKDIIEIGHGISREDWFPEPWFPKAYDVPRAVISGQYERSMSRAKDTGHMAIKAIDGQGIEVFHVSIGSSVIADKVYAHWVSPPTDWLRRIYSSCDFAVVTTRYEGSPILDRELMACGVPVVRGITHDEGDHYLKDGYNCLLSEYSDIDTLRLNVKEISRDATLRASIREGGLEYIESVPSWKEVAKMWMEVIES